MEFEDRGQLSEEDEESEQEEDEEEESEDEIEFPTGFGDSSRLISMSNSAGEPGVVSPTIRKVRYRECLKNHAVGIGGHAVDGCGEFMPAGTEGTLDALKCAACNCHRNFHRKEIDLTAIAGFITGGGEAAYHRQQQQQQQFSPYYRTPAGHLHMAPHLRSPPQLALPSTFGEGGRGSMSMSREAADQEDHSNPNGSGARGGTATAATPTTMMMSTGSGSSKKRFRTKFTNEQKNRMVTLAERLGWRIQKHDEGIVQQFCNESGVKRHVLKVWMHNNKHTLGKKA